MECEPWKGCCFPAGVMCRVTYLACVRHVVSGEKGIEWIMRQAAGSFWLTQRSARGISAFRETDAAEQYTHRWAQGITPWFCLNPSPCPGAIAAALAIEQTLLDTGTERANPLSSL